MSNPVLNDRSLRAAAAGWAPPVPGSELPTTVPPISDGPVTAWRRAMTVGGVVSASAVLLVLLLAAATVGWIRTGAPEAVAFDDGTVGYRTTIPVLAWVGLVVGFVLVMALVWRPHHAKVIGPLYALAEGVFVGAVSRAYENHWDGIVVQAAGATVAVFAVMLVLYRVGLVKVTDRFRKVIVGATLGVAVFYGVCLLLRLFAGSDSVSFLRSPSPLGIAFSVLVSALAAFNLALDFDYVERGAKARLDERFEWFAAVGLLVTIVWLYLELLRLLAKLRER